MSLLNFHPRRLTSKSTAPTLLTLDSTSGWYPDLTDNGGREAAMKLSAVYHAFDYLSNMIGMMPQTVKNWRTQEEVPGHYLEYVLSVRPNEAMGPFVFKKLMMSWVLLEGNSYAYIYRDGDGRAKEEIWLPSDCTRPMLTNDGRLWYQFIHPRSGDVYALDPMDLEHFKGYSLDGISGRSVLRYASDTIAAATAREEYDRAVYENGGSPAGTLETESDLGGPAIDEAGNVKLDSLGNAVTRKDIIRAEWNHVHSGAANAFRVAVLDLGLKYNPLSVNNRDAQFVESKAVSVEDLARFFGMPLNKFMTGKQSYNSNEANSLDVLTDTLQPYVTQFEDEDKYKLLTSPEAAEGLYVRRNMMVTLRADTTSRGAWYEKMRDVGAYSANDILRKEGEPGNVPNGNVHLYNKNYGPLDRIYEDSEKGGTNA